MQFLTNWRLRVVIIAVLLSMAYIRVSTLANRINLTLRRGNNDTVQLHSKDLGIEDSLNLIVSVDGQEFKRSAAIPVTLSIKNAGQKPALGFCAFKLTRIGDSPKKGPRNSLWAPVVVQGKSVKSAESPTQSKIPESEQFVWKLNISELKWGTAIQPIWPNDKLDQFVSAGEYELYFDIVREEAPDKITTESNHLKVKLEN